MGGAVGAVPTARIFSFSLPYDRGDDGEAARTWALQAARAVAAAGWSDSQAATWAALQMRGEAAHWLQELDAATSTSWAALHSAFVKRFSPTLTQAKLQALIAARSLAPGETPRQYWRALSGLYNRVTPAVPAPIRFARFKGGLPPRIADMLVVSGVTTIDAALSLLDNLEMPVTPATVATRQRSRWPSPTAAARPTSTAAGRERRELLRQAVGRALARRLPRPHPSRRLRPPPSHPPPPGCNRREFCAALASSARS